MWACRDYQQDEDMSYGVTYAYKRHMLCYRDFRPSDWPETPKGRRLHPCVTMNMGYETFFRDNFAGASMAQRYRACGSLSLQLSVMNSLMHIIIG